MTSWSLPKILAGLHDDIESRVGKPAELAQSTALVPRERSLSPSTNGQIGVVRRHVLRSAARGGSEHGPYRKSRLRASALPLCVAQASRQRPPCDRGVAQPVVLRVPP